MERHSCKKVCAGKKSNIMYEQCRDAEGKIVSMRRIGNCDGNNSDDISTDVKIVDG